MKKVKLLVCVLLLVIAAQAQDGNAGILIEAKKPRLFANAIFDLFKDKAKKELIADRLFLNVNENYSKANFMKNLFSVYHS